MSLVNDIEGALKTFFLLSSSNKYGGINDYHVYTRKNTDLLLGDFTNLHQHEIMIPKWQILGQSPRPQRLVTDRESRVAIPQQMSEPCE